MVRLREKRGDGKHQGTEDLRIGVQGKSGVGGGVGDIDNSNKRQAAADKELTDQLYQQIGRLKVDGA